MNSKCEPIVYWIRSDMRLHDNIALTEAVKTNQKIIIIYLNNYLKKINKCLSAQDVWIEKSISELEIQYKEKFNIKIIRTANDAKLFFSKLYKLFSISSVYYNKIYEPNVMQEDAHLEKYFNDKIRFYSYNSNLLFDPLEIKNNSGSYFKVFTPYWRNCSQKLLLRNPIKTPRTIRAFNSINLINNEGTLKTILNNSWAKKY